MNSLYDESPFLEHHGIKGQKWGVRRFQNPDGTLTNAGRKRVTARNNIKRNLGTTDDVNDIVRTLTKKEKELLGAEPNKDWIEKEHELETLSNKAKTFVTKVSDTPVSFIEIWSNGGKTGQIAIATRNDPKYRGKGYSNKEVERAIKWADRYGNKQLDELQWIAEKSNTRSNALAVKYGFVRDDDESDNHHDGQYNFYYRKVKKREAKK